MSGTSSITKTFTFTQEDVAKVVRRFTSDLRMIAESSKSMTEAEAAKYGHDVEYLAQRGYLKMVDVTLLSADAEVKAVQYVVQVGSNDLTPSKPGGVLWPEVNQPFLRIILSYTNDYTAAVKEKTLPNLKLGWVPTDASTAHVSLKESGGRDYSSNAFGVTRKDFT
ncbi:hypothetical protein [Roseateles sp.]|uniref:HORMA-1 domain-containing protein n=1 Tax=Roseateles sp. TaxID=1971397 RepID=UPI003D0FD3C9